ncbi:MAG: hypothetical protein H6905_10055 [Hyphomicrobiales bacterium]|nr:hypothetical protein [Hyphomicrobiales bacterium]
MSQAGRIYFDANTRTRSGQPTRTNPRWPELDFIRHINPRAAVRKPAGLVTQFAAAGERRRRRAIPVELTLFTGRHHQGPRQHRF